MGRWLSVSLHVGAHKTATTHLQFTLAANRGRLRRNNIALLVPAELRDPGSNLSERFGLGPADGDGRVGLAHLEQLLPAPLDRLVISEENFIGMWRNTAGRMQLPLYPRAAEFIGKMVDAVAPHPVDLFLSVRDPCRFLWSCYSQVLISGHVMSPFEFFVDSGPKHIDWLDLVRRIRAVPGLRSVGVWPYELYPGNMTHVTRRLLRWRMGRLVEPRHDRDNIGLSEMAMRKTLEWHSEGRSGDLALAARKAHPVGPDWPAYDPFPPEMRAEIRDGYITQLEEIAALDGVELLVNPRVPLADQIGRIDLPGPAAP